jgi:hypothetical protein
MKLLAPGSAESDDIAILHEDCLANSLSPRVACRGETQCLIYAFRLQSDEACFYSIRLRGGGILSAFLELERPPIEGEHLLRMVEMGYLSWLVNCVTNSMGWQSAPDSNALLAS